MEHVVTVRGDEHGTCAAALGVAYLQRHAHVWSYLVGSRRSRQNINGKLAGILHDGLQVAVLPEVGLTIEGQRLLGHEHRLRDAVLREHRLIGFFHAFYPAGIGGHFGWCCAIEREALQISALTRPLTQFGDGGRQQQFTQRFNIVQWRLPCLRVG